MPTATYDTLLKILEEQCALECQLVDSFQRRLDVLFPSMSQSDCDGQDRPAPDQGAYVDLLFEVIAALDDHAREEEGLMKFLGAGGHGRGQYESHIEDHASLSGAMCAIVEGYGIENVESSARQLHRLLKRWRDEHIEAHDRSLVSQITADR